MDSVVEHGTAYWQVLAHYPWAEIFGVLAFAVLVPAVALRCIYLRDHFRNGEGARRRTTERRSRVVRAVSRCCIDYGRARRLCRFRVMTTLLELHTWRTWKHRVREFCNARDGSQVLSILIA